MELFQPFIMLQFVIPDLLEHFFAERVLGPVGIFKIEFPLSHLIVESHLQGTQTFFLIHPHSSLPDISTPHPLPLPTGRREGRGGISKKFG
jgi:hypothetical protein